RAQGRDGLDRRRLRRKVLRHPAALISSQKYTVPLLPVQEGDLLFAKPRTFVSIAPRDSQRNDAALGRVAMAEADVNQTFAAEPRVADRVVDADVHVNPPPTFWADYLSPRYRDQAPTVESDGEFDYIVFEGERRKVNLLSSR